MINKKKLAYVAITSIALFFLYKAYNKNKYKSMVDDALKGGTK